MLLHYLKVAVRQMLKYKSHQLISALCLAVGIICFSYVWLFVDMINEVFELPNYDRRVSLHLIQENWHFSDYSPNEILRLQDELKPLGVEGVAAGTYATEGEVEFIDDEGRVIPYIARYNRTNAYNFTYYGIRVQGLKGELRPYDVVLSASFARKVFGQKNPVGCKLRLVGDDKESEVFQVVGVADGDYLGHQQIDCFFSLMLRPDEICSAQVGVFLPERMDYPAFAQHVEKIVWQRKEGSVTFSSRLIDTDRGQLWLTETLVLVVASLILLSGMINFLKFTFQIFFIRQRELVLRKCMGSSLRGLYALLASEVFLMLTLSFFLSLVLSEILLTTMDGRWPADFPVLSMGDAYPVQGGVYLSTLAAGLLAACFPVARLRRGTLYGSLQSAHRKHTFRNWMIGLQLFISMFFIGGILLINMLWNETFFNGYMPLSPTEQQRVAVLPLNRHYIRKYIDPVLDEVRRMPEVKELTSFDFPGRASWTTSMNYECKDGNVKAVYMQSGHPDYFAFFHIPMEGKAVSSEAGNQIYVSRRFKQFLDEEGNDGTVRLENVDYQIAGVYEALFNETTIDQDHFIGSVFLPSANVRCYLIQMNEHISASDFLKKLTTVCRRFVPETLPLDIHLLTEDDVAKENIALMRLGMSILAIVSLLLVVLSVYSSLSLDTLGRQKEVAIRKINGAKPADIFLLFAKTYLYIFAAAYVLAYALVFIIGIYNFENDPHIECVRSWQWPVQLFVLMSVLLAVVTGWKIRQVMRLNPAEVVKTE